jgi:hypothetical protein
MFPGGGVTSLWFHYYLATSYFYANQPWVGVGNSAALNGALNGTGVFVGTGTGTSGNAFKLALYKIDANGTTQTKVEESGTTLSGPCKVDVQIQAAGWPNVTVTAYVNGVQSLSTTMDLTSTGLSSFNQFLLPANNAGGTNGWMSEFIVADEDTRLFSLSTLAPNAAGDANAWTQTTAGSNGYQDLNETAIDDAAVWYTNATGQDAQVNLTNLPAGTFTVKAVKIEARCARTAGSTAGSIALGVKSGGTIDPGAAQAQQTAWATYERYMAQNPVTANAWQPSDVNALQLNLRSAT